MIVWDSNIRLSEKVADKLEEIKKRVEKRSFKTVGSYCILISPYENPRPEIHNMGALLFRYYRECPENVRIIGVTSSKQEALSMLEELYNEVYAATGDVDLTAYLGTDK